MATNAELQATIQALQAKLAEAEANRRKPGVLTIKGRFMDQTFPTKDANGNVTGNEPGKGGVGVYGLNRFPLTLKPSQWRKLASLMPEVLAFCEANADRLAKD